MDFTSTLLTVVNTFTNVKQSWFDDPFNDGAMHHLFSSYLNDIWLAEFPPPPPALSQSSVSDWDCTACTLEVVDELTSEHYDHGSLVARLTSYGINSSQAPRVALKLRNLLRACTWLFGKDFRPQSHLQSELTVDFIKDVHKKVCADVIKDEDLGAFRKRNVQAHQSSVVYALPQQIEYRIKELIAFFNQKKRLFSTYSTSSTSIESPSSSEVTDQHRLHHTFQMLLLGAFFFSEFLLIHPFADGNGRVARLLTNFLLKDITFVPFSLYYAAKHESRQLYVNVLEQRNDHRLPPIHLTIYILMCAAKAAGDVAYLVRDPNDLQLDHEHDGEASPSVVVVNTAAAVV